VTEEQLRDPVTGPHQIATAIFTGAHEIARGLLVRRRDPDRRDLTKPKQPRQPLGVPPVGLDPVGRRPDPRRRRDNAADPRPGTRTREPVPSRPGLVHDLDWRRRVLNHATVASSPGGTRSDRTSPRP
jgi:hypothetical protein